jgi:NADH-quinone oxidoreductase subunit G
MEEAYLLCTLLRSVDPQALLLLGPVPVVGEDETFANGFTIRAEKCPNRRGVEQVLAMFDAPARPLADALAELEQGEIRGLWVSGGYPTEWIDVATAARLARIELRIVQDLFPSPLSQQATYELPAAAFAEREGSYVNHQGLLQSVSRAIRPPAGVRTEASLFWEMLARPGLYHAGDVLEEMKSLADAQSPGTSAGAKRNPEP